MDIRKNIAFQLNNVREMTNSVLAEFQSRADYLAQPHENANNAIWVVSHVAMADDYMMKTLRPDWSDWKEDWQPKYWYGSSPTGAEDQNISTDEALTYFKERRANVLRVLADVSDEEMVAPRPESWGFTGHPNVGHIFLFCAQHESIHFGQLTVAHRALGKPPIN